MNVSPVQVYQEVMAQGGSQTQAQVAAALVSGIESNGDPQILSGGVGPAQGLFQFEPGTWTGGAGGGKNGLPSTVAASSWQQQVTGFINSSGGKGGSNFQAWGPDLMSNGGDPNSSSNPAYGYTGGPQAGSKVGNIIAQHATSWGAAAPVDLTTGAGGAAGGGTTAGTTATSTAAAQTTNVTIPGSPDAGFNPMPTTMSTTTTNADALKTMQTDLQAYGFSPADAAAVTQAAWTEITNNTDPSQIVIDIQTPGSQFYPIFEKYFPGFVGANQSLQTQGLPAVSVADYQTYTKNAEQLAQAAGLPGGLINKDTIGTLIGGNVSYAELGKRVDDATSLAINSTDEQRSMFNQYFGLMDQYVTADNPFGTGANGFNAHGPLTTGQIAALVLDPKASEPLIHQQITAAQLGGTGVTAGVGAISKDEAVKLAQSGVSGTQSFSQFAPLAPLEQSLVGQTTNAAQNTLTPDQLVEGNLLGTAGDVRAQQVAQESRKAPFSGGGGDVAAASGVVGAGSASPGSKTGQ